MEKRMNCRPSWIVAWSTKHYWCDIFLMHTRPKNGGKAWLTVWILRETKNLFFPSFGLVCKMIINATRYEKEYETVSMHFQLPETKMTVLNFCASKMLLCIGIFCSNSYTASAVSFIWVLFCLFFLVVALLVLELILESSWTILDFEEDLNPANSSGGLYTLKDLAGSALGLKSAGLVSWTLGGEETLVFL